MKIPTASSAAASAYFTAVHFGGPKVQKRNQFDPLQRRLSTRWLVLLLRPSSRLSGRLTDRPAVLASSEAGLLMCNNVCA